MNIKKKLSVAAIATGVTGIATIILTGVICKNKRKEIKEISETTTEQKIETEIEVKIEEESVTIDINIDDSDINV